MGDADVQVQGHVGFTAAFFLMEIYGKKYFRASVHHRTHYVKCGGTTHAVFNNNGGRFFL